MRYTGFETEVIKLESNIDWTDEAIMEKAKELIDKEVYTFEIYKNNELMLGIDAFNNTADGKFTIDLDADDTNPWYEFCREHKVWNYFNSKFLVEDSDEVLTDKAVAYFGLTDNGPEENE